MGARHIGLFVTALLQRCLAAAVIAKGQGSYPVTDPTKPFLTVLPSGRNDLTRYRATPDVYDEYRLELPFGDGRDNPNPSLPDCTRAELDALNAYTGGANYELNDVLRNNVDGAVDGVPIPKRQEARILMTASGLACLPRVSAYASSSADHVQRTYQRVEPGHRRG